MVIKLPKPRKMRPVKTLPAKALRVIEEITCNDDFSDNSVLSACYRYSHVAIGHCLNKHEDWAKELEDTYAALQSHESKRR